MTQQLKILSAKSMFIAPLLLMFFFVQFAGANPADQSEIEHFEAINYFKVRHLSGYSVAVIGFLSPEVQLPATVELAIPAGSEIVWFSEVSGGPIANDPEFSEPFNVRTENALDIYTVTLEHYHSVQIEYGIDQNPVTQLSDGVYSIQMSYTPIADLPVLRLMTNFPAETIVQDPDVEFMGEDTEGDLVFFRIYADIAAFQTVQDEITYFPPAGQGMVAASGGLWGGLTVTVIAVITVIALAAGFIFFTQKRKEQVYEE